MDLYTGTKTVCYDRLTTAFDILVMVVIETCPLFTLKVSSDTIIG